MLLSILLPTILCHKIVLSTAAGEMRYGPYSPYRPLFEIKITPYIPLGTVAHKYNTPLICTLLLWQVVFLLC